jgi:hypothetical protein
LARKERKLASFGDVASEKGIENDNINNNDNVNNNNEHEHGTDYLDELIEGPKKKQEKALHGLYLDPDVAKILDNLGEKGGRGAKSKIANEALRKLFMEKGLL